MFAWSEIPNFVKAFKPWEVIKVNYCLASRSPNGIQVVQSTPTVSNLQVGWIPPSPGWMCINTYNAMKRDLGVAGGRGLLRDHSWTWMGVFSKILGNTSAYLVECWGVFKGLSSLVPRILNRWCYKQDRSDDLKYF